MLRNEPYRFNWANPYRNKMDSSMSEEWLDQWPTGTSTENSNPFVSEAFLSALEQAGVCSREHGWQPSHLRLTPDICVPAYLRTDSWGEYVFDWAWSSAYEQHGLAYYPKLVIAAPFTPSQGPRLLGAKSLEDVSRVVQSFKTKCLNDQLSGFHLLFPAPAEHAWLDQQGLLKRSDVQFHWRNRNYRDFDDFLERFSSRKRKNVRKERQSIIDQGITMRALTGSDITDSIWLAFYQFYHATYLKRGRQGYLNKEFFDRVRTTMNDRIVLMMAFKDEEPIAGALCFRDQERLYGRYWGCFEEYPNLHFEACYYQGIEYCIAQGLTSFDPGTQGEHKIARGFEPTMTHSYHWLAHPEFFVAAQHFCAEERERTDRYLAQTQAALPFKQLTTQSDPEEKQ